MSGQKLGRLKEDTYTRPVLHKKPVTPIVSPPHSIEISSTKEPMNREIKGLASEVKEVKEIREQLQLVTTQHISSMKTHRYVKFNDNNPCFYIIESGIPCSDCGNSNIQYKFGIAGVDVAQKNTIDNRLQCHRTLWPRLKVRFLLFVRDVVLIEKSFKVMYEKEINPNGHEIISGVPLEDLVGRLEKLLDVMGITEYYITTEENLKRYNDYVDATVKPVDK